MEQRLVPIEFDERTKLKVEIKLCRLICRRVGDLSVAVDGSFSCAEIASFHFDFHCDLPYGERSCAAQQHLSTCRPVVSTCHIEALSMKSGRVNSRRPSGLASEWNKSSPSFSPFLDRFLGFQKSPKSTAGSIHIGVRCGERLRNPIPQKVSRAAETFHPPTCCFRRGQRRNRGRRRRRQHCEGQIVDDKRKWGLRLESSK